jgi:hypothetical protein
LRSAACRNEHSFARIVTPSPFHEEADMGRYMLLWLLGVPIPILLVIWAFGGLN